MAKKLKLVGIIKKFSAQSGGSELALKNVQCGDDVVIALNRYARKKKKDEEEVAVTIEPVEPKLEGTE